MALANARYRVPLSAEVRPASDNVDVVAFVTFDQFVPASSERCHWYETAAPPSDVAETVRLADAAAVLVVA